MSKPVSFIVTFAFLFSALVLVTPMSAYAAISPLAVDIIAPVQFPPSDFSVTGLRISAIYGDHRAMYGFDFGGIGNVTELDFAGLAVSGIFNYTKGTTTVVGIQAAGIINMNLQKTTVLGVQVAAVNFNEAESTVGGFEIGPIANIAPHTTIDGFQIGLYNKAYEVNGFQIGLVNSTTMLHGLQIGLINFNDKGLFTICPILNFGF